MLNKNTFFHEFANSLKSGLIYFEFQSYEQSLKTNMRVRNAW